MLFMFLLPTKVDAKKEGRSLTVRLAFIYYEAMEYMMSQILSKLNQINL